MLNVIIPIFFLILAVIKLYYKLSVKWCTSPVCLLNKTAIVTGSNTGIGYQVALDFAKRGARVILACRNLYKAETAKRRIMEETGNKNIKVKFIDLSSFKSVRAFAREINETEDRLDILVNNAGTADFEHRVTEDGNVLIVQVNYLSSFLLTNLLLGLMKKTINSRIINVSSILAAVAFNFNVKNFHLSSGFWQGYQHSKLCTILFTMELARRLEGTDVTTYSLHPGVANTNIFAYVTGFLNLPVHFVKNLVSITVEECAQTVIYCSLTRELEKYNGKHFDNCSKVKCYWTARTPAGLPEKLWEISEKIVRLESDEMEM